VTTDQLLRRRFMALYEGQWRRRHATGKNGSYAFDPVKTVDVCIAMVRRVDSAPRPQSRCGADAGHWGAPRCIRGRECWQAIPIKFGRLEDYTAGSTKILPYVLARAGRQELEDAAEWGRQGFCYVPLP